MTLPAHFRGLCLTLVAILAAGSLVCPRAAAEEDFRIENKVFVDAEKEPRVRSTTIFHEGMVYDYLAEPAEVTVFDARHSRFVLLDLTRRIKTELTTERVVNFSERLKEWAEGQSDEFLQFLADPQFEEEADESTHALNFTSPWMTYRMTTVGTESEDISGQYREFADWYCRLNTVLNPGARPPFARMKINAALHERQQFPREVELTVQPKESFLANRLTVRSEHLLIRQLVESDRKRVAQTDQFIAMYTAVGFEEYQRKMAN